MMKTTLSIIIFFIATLTFAQENSANQWFFGEYCGVDFSHGVPYGISGGQITGWEGCATVGDMQGNLLFYTDGQVVYNKNHEIMENGTGLMGHWSSVQSSIIVRMPGSDKLFYIFTTDDSAIQHLANGWRYSIVDMTLDGGLGAITETKNVLLEEMVTEKQVAIMHGNNMNVWIIAHRWNSNEFIAYEISQVGISETPIISALGVVHEGGYSPNPEYNGWSNAVGCMKTTMAGDKIALAIQIMGIYELFDFDKHTGVISNCRTSPSYTAAYGVEFSPDGTKLYATNNIYGVSNLLQYNLDQADPFSNAITIATESHQNEGIQLGPNGKIYVTRFQGYYLAAIHKPNEHGANCEYESDALYLQGEMCRRGLPSIFYYKGLEFFTGSIVEVEICEGDEIFLENAYQTEPGIYYDTVESYLGWDSIVNTHLTFGSFVTATISESSGILLSSYLPDYQWYLNGAPISGANSNSHTPIENGNYQVGPLTANSCYAISNAYLFIVDDRIDDKIDDIEIFPNPSNNLININLTSNAKVCIYNVAGQQVLCEDLNNSCQIDISNLGKGLYIIKIYTEGETIVQKLIVE